MKNKFEFSEAKEGFDNHIYQSIPGYDSLFNLTVNLSHHWLNEDSLPVIDIGGSTGKLLNKVQLDTDIKIKNKFFNIDPTIFESSIDNNLVTFIHENAQDYLKTIRNKAQIFYSIFTLQFLGSYERQLLLSLMVDKLDDDGAIFIAEKFYMDTPEYQELYSVILKQMKREHFSDTDILDKDNKLLKHLKLKTENEFITEMNNAGLKCTKYWQSLHFNSYICTKV
jgi:hypothetical protein